MTKKTKILVSVSVICLVISVALVTVVAVFAATSHTITNTVSVSYSVTDVIGSCQASYKIANSASFTDMSTVNFQAADTNNTHSMTKNGLTLTSANNYVEFRYIFKNTSSSTDGKPYKIALTYTDDSTADKNVDIEYYFGTSATATYTGKTSVVAKWSSHAIGPTTAPTINGGGTYYVFIKVSIHDINTGAAFSGNFNWSVTAA